MTGSEEIPTPRAEELRKLVDGALDIGVVCVDRDQRIVFFSRGAEELFGYKAQEVLGRPVSILTPPELAEPQRRGVRRFVNSGQAWLPASAFREHRLRGLRKDGSQFYAEVSVRRMRWEGRPVFVAYVRDVTARVEAEEALREALDRLSQETEARSHLMLTVSHELRTPLASLKAACEVLAELVPEPERSQPERSKLHARLVNIMRRNIHRLEFLADDLLNMLELERGGLRLEREWAQVGPLIAEAVNTVFPIASRLLQKIDVSIEDPSLELYVDRRRIEQALLNLLYNAQKYSPTGSTIRVQCRTVDGWYEIRIVDEGVGVREEDRPYLFEPYFRGAGQDTTLPEGRGLGLSIARDLVELHGGQVGYEPLPRGSAFYVRLPLGSPQEVASQGRQAEDRSGHEGSGAAQERA